MRKRDFFDPSWDNTNVFLIHADGAPTIPAEVPNILTKLKDFESAGTMPELMQVYLLPWIIHLIGDVHQPLHAITRFSRDFPKGDRGGNSVRLKDGSNLHRIGMDGLEHPIVLGISTNLRRPLSR